MFWRQFYIVHCCSSGGLVSIPGWGKLCEPVPLQTFGLQKRIVPYLKDIFLRSHNLKGVVQLVGVLLECQITPKSLHKMYIDLEWMTPAVYSLPETVNLFLTFRWRHYHFGLPISNSSFSPGSPGTLNNPLESTGTLKGSTGSLYFEYRSRAYRAPAFY